MSELLVCFLIALGISIFIASLFILYCWLDDNTAYGAEILGGIVLILITTVLFVYAIRNKDKIIEREKQEISYQKEIER